MALMVQRFVVVLCFGCAVLGAMPARADSRAEPTNPEARTHFDQGGKLFGLQEFEKAIDEYKQGALIENLPVFDLALGQCYRMLGQYKDAIWYFDRFIKYGHPTGKLLKGINNLIAEMRKEPEKTAITQEPAELTPVATPEHRPVVSSAPAVPAVPAGQPPSPRPPAMGTIVDDEAPWYRDRIGLGLVSIGAAATGVASYLLLDANRLHNESNTDPSQTRRVELHDRAHSRYQLSTATGIGGVSVLVVGIIRLASRRPDRTRQAPTSWNVGSAGNGVMVFGQF